MLNGIQKLYDKARWPVKRKVCGDSIINPTAEAVANNVESNKKSINKWNEDISQKLSGLQDQYNRIIKDDKTILRQTSMVEFSKEKNNAASNQIGLYIALNIAAIGMIFFVSRSL